MIENGSIVWLKSGGPAMTASWVSDPSVICTWFINDEIKEYKFYKDSLTTENPN